MAKFIQHADTHVVQSVTDDRLADALAVPGWEEIDEETAREAQPQLFGAPDPAVDAVRDHDGYGRLVTFTPAGHPIPPADESTAE